MKKSGLSTAMLVALVGGGLAGCSHNCYDRGEGCFSGSSSAETTGKVVDGYVANANVYLANADGSCSTTVAGTTDAKGNFTLSVADPNGICASGGTDTSTNQPLVGTLKAPAGSSGVTPLTTMYAAALAANPGLSESSFATSLGLGGVNLLSADPEAPGAPANLEQVGASIQALIASIALSLGGGNAANANAIYASVVSAVLTTISNLPAGTTLTSIATSGGFSSIATSIATTAQTNVAAAAAANPSDAALAAAATASAAVTPAELATAANSAASSASTTSSSNAPPPAAFSELASVSANGTIQGAVPGTGYDSSLTIHGAFTSVSFGLTTATGNAVLAATGSTSTIAVVPATGSSSQNLTVSIPTDWAESPTTNGTLTPSVTAGSQVTVTGTKSDGTSVSATLAAATVTGDGTLSTSAGTITLNLSQLLTDLGGANSNFALLVGYNGGTGTAVGKSYVITTSLPGVALKTLGSTTAAPVSTFSYTTEVTFD